MDDWKAIYITWECLFYPTSLLGMLSVDQCMTSIGKRVDPNSVRPSTQPIGRYTGRVSGWECCHPLRIGHSSGGLTEMQAKPDSGEAFEGRSGNCGWAGDPM